jgi:hypothetical protein
MPGKRKLAVPETFNAHPDDPQAVLNAVEAFNGTWDESKWESIVAGLSTDDVSALKLQFSKKINFESNSLALLKMLPAYKELELLEIRVDTTMRHLKQRMSEQIRSGFSKKDVFHRDHFITLLDKVHPPPSSESLKSGLSHVGMPASSSSSIFGPIASSFSPFAPVACSSSPFGHSHLAVPSTPFGGFNFGASSTDVPMACALELCASVEPLSSDSEL